MENEKQITTNDLAGMIKRSFDGVDKKLDGVNQRFDSVDKRFDGIDQRLAGNTQRLDKLAENQGVIMTKLEDIVHHKEFDELRNRVEAIENALSLQKS